MRNLPLMTIALALLGAARPAYSQENPGSFVATYTFADGNVHALTNGTPIIFPNGDTNGGSVATVEILNQTTAPGLVTGVSISGEAFLLSGLPLLPATLNPGQSFRFGIRFAPSQNGSFSGSYRIDLAGRTISGTLGASTANSNVSLAYVDPDTNNAIAIRDGATIPFPATVTGTSSSVAVIVSNNGLGTAVLQSVVLNAGTSPAFQLNNLPAFPASVPAAQQLRFSVRFSPQQQQAFSGAMALNINGRVMTMNLQALGSGSQFTYVYGRDTAVKQGGTVALGEVAMGQSVKVPVLITNSGNADGPVPSITVTGAGFSVSDLPSLPFTLSPGASQAFTLSYSPAEPGAVIGRLIVGKDLLTLTATGMGSRLVYSYSYASPEVPLNDGGTVIFPPLEIGRNEKLQFSVQNTGTTAASILSISLAAGTNFALEQLPAMPFNLEAGATAAFIVSFAPGATGSLSGTLRVNNSSFALVGSGNPPAALPSYQIQTSNAAAQPAQQGSVGLTLASPYPYQIEGTLKLSFTSAVFVDDPAIQFASGGRTVNFTIPANSTRALFNGNLSVPYQTGTTAGTILITPTFAMRSGFDMTPLIPDSLSISVPKAAPQLLTAGITSQTTNSFTLVLSGYSTSRSMRQFDVQFTPRQGENFSTTKLTIDLNTAASAWYQSTSSQATGGSFLVAVPFLLQNGGSADDLLHRLQSLSITATNDTGVSAAIAVPIP